MFLTQLQLYKWKNYTRTDLNSQTSEILILVAKL